MYNDPAIVSEVMEACEESVKVAGLKAQMSTAAQVDQDLQAKEAEALRHWESVTEKYDKINHFDEQVVKIGSLFTNN